MVSPEIIPHKPNHGAPGELEEQWTKQNHSHSEFLSWNWHLLKKARLWWVRYCCYSSPLSRRFPPHFQWSLRPSPPSRASSQSVARPWWVNDDKGPRWTRGCFVCFGRGKLLATWKTYSWRPVGGANGRSIKPPRSTKQRDEENLRDRNSMFIQLWPIGGFTGRFVHTTLGFSWCNFGRSAVWWVLMKEIVSNELQNVLLKKCIQLKK